MKKIKLIILLILFGNLSCMPPANLLDGLSSKTTDDYLIIEAEEANNAQSYDVAIDILINQISNSAKSTVKVKELLANAYAGKCGLNFVQYTTDLANSTTGSAFEIVMTPFVGAVVTPSYCYLALQTMDTIGTELQRTDNQNAFVAVTGLVYIGASLRYNSDQFPVNGDGSPDVNLCTGLTDAQLDETIIGFGYFTTNFSYVSASLLGSTTLSSLDQVVQICTVTAGSSCNAKTSSDITPAMRLVIRDLINTQEYGIGSYSTGGNDLLLPGSCP